MFNNISLFIGHLVGDYIFQNDAMAVNKSKSSTKGLWYCVLHCSIYAMCVATFVVMGGWRFEYSPSISWSLLASFVIAYVSHYPIDRHSLATKWMEFFRQTQFKHVCSWHKADESCEVNNIKLRAFFVAPVYIAIDNTFHLVIMWLLFSWLGN